MLMPISRSRSGLEFITFTCKLTKLMQVYTAALLFRGVVFSHRKINSFQELVRELPSSLPPVVINCLGLGSLELGDILNDRQIGPSRGQVRRVDAPWMFHVFTNDSAYVIPNTGSVTMGGIKQVGDYELKSREQDAANLTRGCCGIISALEWAPIKGHFVGLRPLRQPFEWRLKGLKQV